MLITEDNFHTQLAALDKSPILVVDTETTGLTPWSGDELIGIAHCNELGEVAGYFGYRHVNSFDDEYGNLPYHLFCQHLDWLDERRKQDTHIEVGYNYKFDMQFLMKEGLGLPKKMEDPILMAHLVNENERSFKLEDIAAKYVDPAAGLQEEGLLATLATLGFKNTKADPAKSHLKEIPASSVAAYASQDVRLTAKLRNWYWPKITWWKLNRVADEMFQYSITLTEAEARGLKIDRQKLIALHDEATVMRERTADEFRDMVGEPTLNLRSPLKVQKALGVSSTAAEYLEIVGRSDRLSGGQRAAIAKLQEHRSWDKVLGSYLEPYAATMDQDGIIHPNFNMNRVITGRLSMSKPAPNLMAIPHGDEDPAMGRVKSLFIARDGFVLLNMDESQAELRVIAHYAQEQQMIQWLEAGADIHAETRDLLESMGTVMTRDDAKRINFGVAYGLGKRGLSQKTGRSESEAGQILNSYHRRFPGFRILMNKSENHAMQNGFIRLWTGRVRHFNDKFQDPHKAMSNLIQGGVAECIRVAMTRLRGPLGELGASQLLQVHDSIMMEVPAQSDVVLEAYDIAKTIMEDFPFSVKMRADAEVGKSWGEAQKIKNREEIEEWVTYSLS